MPEAKDIPEKPAGRLVTADTLAVAPAVLGQPLAEPWRRLTAMALDIVVVGLLSGIVPASRAVRISALEAIRHD